MKRLVELFSISPPGSREFLLLPVVLVISYMAFLHIGAELAALSLSPFVLSVVLTQAVGAIWLGQLRLRRCHDASRTPQVFSIVTLVGLAFLLAAQDPVWCQRFVSLVIAVRAAYLARALYRGETDLSDHGGPRSAPASFTRHWGQWKLYAFLALFAVNELAIAFASLTEWIIISAFAPMIAYCVLQWSMVALWDGGADAR